MRPRRSTSDLQQTAANHIIDLIALTLGATREAARVAAGQGVRAARLQSIKSDILANLNDEQVRCTLSRRGTR